MAASYNATGHFLASTRVEPQARRDYTLKDKGGRTLLGKYNLAPKANLVSKTKLVTNIKINLTKSYP